MHKNAAAGYIPTRDDMDPDDLESFPDPLTNRDYRDTNYGDRNHVHASYDRVAHQVEVFAGNRRVAAWKGAELDNAMVTGALDPRNVEASAVRYVNEVVIPASGGPEFEDSVHEYLEQQADDAVPGQTIPLFDDDVYRVHIVEKFGPECAEKNLPAAVATYPGRLTVDMTGKTGKLR